MIASANVIDKSRYCLEKKKEDITRLKNVKKY